MKNLIAAACLLLSVTALHAQELQFPSGKEKHDNKPARFQALQTNQRYRAEASTLHTLMSLSPGQKIHITIANGFNFNGVVSDKRNETPDLLTLTANTNEANGSTFTLSRVMIDGQPLFRGAIMGKHNSDIIILEPDEIGTYGWTVKKVSQLLAD